MGGGGTWLVTCGWLTMTARQHLDAQVLKHTHAGLLSGGCCHANSKVAVC